MDKFIKINGKDYNLKITLGFYKKLSFPKSELNNIHDNSIRLFEAVKLAVYFGNKQDKGWLSIADMDKEISDDMFDDIDDGNIIEKLSQAIYDNYSDSHKEAVDKFLENSKEDDLKKK
jgi:hypothetical protein